GCDHWKTPNKLWNQAELQQIFRFHAPQDLPGVALVRPLYIRTKTNGLGPTTAGDDLLQPGKGTTADEEDICRVDLEELLLGMFPAALGRHRGDGPLHDLQQSLLHAFTRYVAGDGGIVRLARDLVDLVDVDDAPLGSFDVVVRCLQELQDDVLDVLAHIARFSQGGRVGHGKGHIQDPSQGLGKQRFAAAGGPDQQDIRLGQFDVVVLLPVRQALVVIVNRDGEDPLGVRLADDVVIQHVADVARRRHSVAGFHQAGLMLLTDNIHAEFDTFIADKNRRPRDELAYLVLTLPAERAVEGVFGIAAA